MGDRATPGTDGFRTRFLVRFHHADITRVMFEGHFVGYAQQALERFVRETDIGWRAWFVAPDYRVLLRSLSLDVDRTVEPGCDVDVRLSVRDLGPAGFGARFEFLLPAASDERCGRIDARYDFVDRSDGRSVAIPARIRDCLARYRVDGEEVDA